jgi:hypothetical protein
MFQLRSVHTQIDRLRARSFELCFRLRHIRTGSNAGVVPIFRELQCLFK